MKLSKILESIDEKATFTDKYDSEMPGNQKKLPDQLQQAILKKKGVKKEGQNVLGQPSSDHEATMAKGELRDMIMNGAKVYKMIQPGTELPGWISAYITLASDYMHSIAEYMTEQNSEEL